MLDLRKETFRSALAQILQILCLKYLFVLAMRNYLQPLVGSQGNSNNLSCFGSLLDSPDQQLKKDFSCLRTMPRKFLLYSGYPTCIPAVDAWVTGALHLPRALLHENNDLQLNLWPLVFLPAIPAVFSDSLLMIQEVK